jgi:hypothetical protein
MFRCVSHHLQGEITCCWLKNIWFYTAIIHLWKSICVTKYKRHNFVWFTVIFTTVKFTCVAYCVVCYNLQSLRLKSSIYIVYAHVWLWPAVAVVDFTRLWQYMFSVLQLYLGPLGVKLLGRPVSCFCCGPVSWLVEELSKKHVSSPRRWSETHRNM